MAGGQVFRGPPRGSASKVVSTMSMKRNVGRSCTSSILGDDSELMPSFEGHLALQESKILPSANRLREDKSKNVVVKLNIYPGREGTAIRHRGLDNPPPAAWIVLLCDVSPCA
eukprot:scaffold22985_cov178-Amphora_coffeaeformis.AAC.3